MRRGKIRHYGFSRRKNKKCRNPSHALAPRRNPSPLLRPVTLAPAHVPTDQCPIWSNLKNFRVSCSYVLKTCLAQTPALPEIPLLPVKDVCRNIITICTPTQKTGDSPYFLQLLLSDKHNYHQHQNFCNTKKILRGINFVKITKKIFSSVDPESGHSCLAFVQYPRDSPRSAWGLQKKSVPQRIPVKITKQNYKKKPGGELICRNFGVNGT